MRRDTRLDVWRGICLVDVVLVHLAFNGIGFPQGIDAAIRDYTRFAAGGFVLLAGLTVAAVFGPMAERSEEARRDVYRRLWRRAAWLVIATVAIESAYRMIDRLRVFPTHHDTPLGEALGGILLLRVPGALGGILLLYTFLLAATPLLFEVRRRLGDAPIVVASALLYASALGLGDTLVWPQNEFPVPYWQGLFVAGFVASRALPALSRSPARLAAWAALSLALWLALLLIQFGSAFGVAWPGSIVALDFTKTPLRAGALLWYLATVNVVLALTSLGWRRLAGTPTASVLALLGRNSLLVYGAHVFTEIPLLEMAWSWAPPAPVALVFAAVDLAALAGICALSERLGAGWTRGLITARPRLAHAAACVVIALAVTAAALAPSPARSPRFAASPPAELVEPGLIAEVDLAVETLGPGEPGDTSDEGDFSPLDLLESAPDGLLEVPENADPDRA